MGPDGPEFFPFRSRHSGGNSEITGMRWYLSVAMVPPGLLTTDGPGWQVISGEMEVFLMVLEK